jgi:C4-dicarboxylate-specific signal transduction histidine kinase
VHHSLFSHVSLFRAVCALQTVETLEREQRARAQEAENQQRLAMQLYTDNIALYSRLQLSHASLEQQVRQRTTELQQRNEELEKARKDAEDATRSKRSAQAEVQQFRTHR